MQLRRVTAQFRDLLGQHESTAALRRVAATCGTEEFGLYFAKASTTQTIQLRTLRAVGVRDRLPVPQSQNVSALEALIVKFSEATESVFVKYAQRALHQGLLLQRLADGAALIYFSTCALSRAQAAASAKAGSAETEKTLAELYTHFACGELKTLCG
ncbi:MAG: hypothetical protein Q8J71_05670, partial [Brevundimonas sp.]|nr:hypothetical protein [Brevundimonas sp.]